jgi:hypothetical protein
LTQQDMQAQLQRLKRVAEEVRWESEGEAEEAREAGEAGEAGEN